jgi:hypothetical protein
MRGNLPSTCRTIGVFHHVTKAATERNAHASQNGSEVVALNALVEVGNEDSHCRKVNLEEIKKPDPVVLIFTINASKGHNHKLVVAVKGYRKKNDVLEHARSRKSSVTHQPSTFFVLVAQRI